MTLEILKLLEQLLPIGIRTYEQLRSAHREYPAKSIEEILAESDAVLKRVIEKAEREKRRLHGK